MMTVYYHSSNHLSELYDELSGVYVCCAGFFFFGFGETDTCTGESAYLRHIFHFFRMKKTFQENNDAPKKTTRGKNFSLFNYYVKTTLYKVIQTTQYISK